MIEEEEKHGQMGCFSCNFAQKWYFSEGFDTQLCFDMCCAVKALKFEVMNYILYKEYRSNPFICRVLPYPVIFAPSISNLASTI